MTACILPPPLDDLALLAYLDGEIASGVADHLGRCPYCCSRAAELAAQERPLRTLLFRIDCPSPDQWRDFYFNLLVDDETAALAAHLQHCPYCTHEMLALQAFVPHPTQDAAPQPAASRWGRLRWWVAQLLQGPPVPVVAGLRGSAGDGQWIYRAGEIQLGVDSRPDRAQPDRRVLVGALLAEDPQGWEAYLWQGMQLIATAQVDDLGGFSFAGLPRAAYELTLAGPETRIYLPGLSVN